MLAEDWVVESLLVASSLVASSLLARSCGASSLGAFITDSELTGSWLRLKVLLPACSEHKLAEWSCSLEASSLLGTSGCMSS